MMNLLFKLALVIILLCGSSCTHKLRVINGQEPYPFSLIEAQLDTNEMHPETGWTLLEYSENTSRRKRHVLYTPDGRKYIELTLETGGSAYIWYDGDWGTTKSGNYEQIAFQIREIHQRGTSSTSIIKLL